MSFHSLSFHSLSFRSLSFRSPAKDSAAVLLSLHPLNSGLKPYSITPMRDTLLNPPPDLEATLAQLRAVPVLASLNTPGYQDALRFLATQTHHLHCQPGDVLMRQGERANHFWILLAGHVEISYTTPQGVKESLVTLDPGTTFGEVPLLSNMPVTSSVIVSTPAELLELDEEQFWTMMNRCPGVRKEILGNMAMRLSKVQQATFQQEKMASLGTLAAGLMHELNNPGSAARRASQQLRSNLERMHQLSENWAKTNLDMAQKQCMYDLQKAALSARPKVMLDSLAQADAEDSLAEWLDAAGLDDAWKVAPTLVSIGMDQAALACAHTSLTGEAFPMALHWLEAMVSSMQLVGTIEESIGRVTDLVHAVKTYAYESRGQQQAIDINNSIHATLIILAHKLREKEIKLEKQLDPKLPALKTDCQGVNQVWTNLIDNAIDAVPQGGTIRIKTWSEPDPAQPQTQPPNQTLCILIADNGEGIPVTCQAHIFDPFFTTKPVGIGTGLGLGIVYRAVDQCGGHIHFTSAPGDTEFLVRLPSTH